MIYRALFALVLRHLDAERAHHLGLGVLGFVGRWRWGVWIVERWAGPHDPRLAVDAFGLRFASPVGVAAGLDKDARAFAGLGALGFGSVEVGTLTAVAQAGNPRPRVFRIPAHRALVNRMGFPNAGAKVAAGRLATRRRGLVVGANIGKSKGAADAVADYHDSALALAEHCDYLVVNVSSPNTPGLRDLQAVGPLREILSAVKRALDEGGRRDLPLLVKIAPDLSDEDILAIADLAVELGLAGIVATNTTIAAGTLAMLSDAAGRELRGGASGPPVGERALDVLRLLRARVGDRLVLVAAGGICNAADVQARLDAGATLVQVYTGLIYEGPGWLKRLHRDLLRLRTRRAGEDPGCCHQRTNTAASGHIR